MAMVRDKANLYCKSICNVMWHLKKRKAIGTNFHLKAMCPCWYILPFGICKNLRLFHLLGLFFFSLNKIVCLCQQVSHNATHHYLKKKKRKKKKKNLNKVLMGSLMVNIQSRKAIPNQFVWHFYFFSGSYSHYCAIFFFKILIY